MSKEKGQDQPKNIKLAAPKPELPPPPVEMPKKKPKGNAAPYVPVFLNVSLTSTAILVVIVGVATALVSLLSGAVLWVSIARAGAAILSIGFLLWVANYLMARQALELELKAYEQKLKEEQEKPSLSTIEFHA